ncbi:MAG: hypothetical protein J6C54_03745 [Lachnospiraceae bacterium]|nr:hypothetical protein [Lachnospiraceae bacterium]
MRVLKTLLAMVVAFSLINTMNVCAEEHFHEFVITEEKSTEVTDDYCKLTTITVTYSCYCGYVLEDKTTEYISHEWEVVCVDPVNNGYQQVCSKCGRTKGNIAYPVYIDEKDYQ